MTANKTSGRCRNHEEHYLDMALKKIRNKVKFDYDYEPEKVTYTIDTPKIYTPDFRVVREDGSVFYIEYKGYFRKEDRQKMDAVKKSRPDLDIRIIFRENHKTGKVERVSDWCEKRGFKYAIGEIPLAWFREKAADAKAPVSGN